jgi:hypothetical protein
MTQYRPINQRLILLRDSGFLKQSDARKSPVGREFESYFFAVA